WQDKRSQEILDRLTAEGRAEEIRRRSGMPLDPYFSAGKLAWLLEHDDAVAKAVEAGTARLGTVDSFLCDRLGADFATDSSTASRTQLGAPEWDPELLGIFGVPAGPLPRVMDTAGDLGTLRHDSGPVELPLRARFVDQQAALAGAGCVEPGLVKATYGTGVFVLAHAGTERPQPGGGLLPTVAWRVDGRVEWAIDGGVFTAGGRPGRRSPGLGPAAAPARRSPRQPRLWRTRAACACFRRSPAWALRGGSPRRAAWSRASPPAPGRRTWRAPRSRRSRGGWPTWSPWCARRSPWRCCGWTAG